MENWEAEKRTLADQMAIRLAKRYPKLKIKIVREGEDLSSDFGSVHSTILVINNPVKTWFTSKHTDEIISCLIKICTNAKKKKKSYIIAIFHCYDSDSFERQIDENNIATMVKMFPSRKYVGK